MDFSNTVDNTGILQQVRKLMRVDSSQWPTVNVVNSVNNWNNFLAGYAIGADKRFQWDDTNHTKLPIGTTNLVANQADYSFLTDEQGNRILTLTRLEMLDSNGQYILLHEIDESEIYDAIDQEQSVAGQPRYYDKIADNIIRLYPKPVASVTSGLKFYFQRAPAPFTAASTTTEPGFAPELHRGFVIAAAYDGALTLGLQNLQALKVELQEEKLYVERHFANRNNDIRKQFTMAPVRFR